MVEHPQFRLQGSVDMAAVARCWRGLALGLAGQLEEADTTLKQCASDVLGEALNDMGEAIDAGGIELFRHLWHWESARLARLRGDAKGLRTCLTKALESAEAVGAAAHAVEIRAELAG